MDRDAALGQRNRLQEIARQDLGVFRRAPRTEFGTRIDGGGKSDLDMGLSQRPGGPPWGSRILPEPSFGIRQVRPEKRGSVREFETVMSVPAEYASNYEGLYRRLVRRTKDGRLGLVSHQRAYLAGAAVQRLATGAIGTGCAYVSAPDGPALLTCAHVLTDVAAPSEASRVNVAEPAGSGWVAASITKLLAPGLGRVNEHDAGLVAVDRVASNRTAHVRPDLDDCFDLEFWGAVSGSSRCEVALTHLGATDLFYDDEVDPLVFRDLIRVRADDQFARRGDSGSLLCEAGHPDQAVGMLVAVAETPDDDGEWIAYAIPLAATLSALNATLI